MADNVNPILYIEELQRLPLRRRRPPVPGSVSVYRSRNGRLRLPAGGYTAGELLFRGPSVVYDVDIARHTAEVTCELIHGGAPLDLEISFAWQVVDPIAVVANRLTDPFELCRGTLQAYLQRVVEELAEPADLSPIAPFHVDLPEGIRLSVRQINRGLPADALPVDLREQWQRHFGLARRARQALDGSPDTATVEAVAAYAELVEEIGKVVHQRSGEDPE